MLMYGLLGLKDPCRRKRFLARRGLSSVSGGDKVTKTNEDDLKCNMNPLIPHLVLCDGPQAHHFTIYTPVPH